MITSQLKDLIRPLVLVQRVIWIIITCSILFYSFLAIILIGNNQSGGVRSTMGLETVLYILAVAFAGSSFFYHRYSLSNDRLIKFLERDTDIETLSRELGSTRIDPERLRRLELLSEFEKKAFSLMYELQKISLINLILNEMVIILGFVVAFLGGYSLKIIPFGFVSLVLSVWMFPKPVSVIERAQNLFLR